MCSSWDYLIFPGSWAKVGLVISLVAIAKSCLMERLWKGLVERLGKGLVERL